MEFPSLGDNCSHSTCNRLDFLPMKCDVCKKLFCGDHFHYLQHGCEGAHKKNVQVPACPLCNAPVPGRRGEAPDVAVSAHLDNDCQADPAKQRRNKVFTNKCFLKGCKVKEMVPLICPECSCNFCFRHRHAADHKCDGKLGAKRRMAEIAAMKRLKNKENVVTSSNTNASASNNVPGTFAEVQGNMSEDEALARALALSLQDEPNPNNQRNNPSILRNVPNRQRVGGEQSNGKCTVS